MSFAHAPAHIGRTDAAETNRTDPDLSEEILQCIQAMLRLCQTELDCIGLQRAGRCYRPPTLILLIF
jgi:hypothetical protein